jgi:hypothetical protein
MEAGSPRIKGSAGGEAPVSGRYGAVPGAP